MMTALARCTILAVAFLLTFGSSYDLPADDKHKKGQRHQEGFHKGGVDNGGDDHEAFLKPVTNETYKENCGACHFAYQPGLLPSGSWAKILSNLKDHFGEAVDIDAQSKDIIAKYVLENSAETSGAKRPVKIMKSLKGQTPSRITEIPYIRHKHEDLSPEVFARKSVGSMSNCSACHKTADQGIYEDDNVVIPK
jgi:hypothetical protein